jgi:hypothetical protein
MNEKISLLIEEGRKAYQADDAHKSEEEINKALDLMQSNFQPTWLPENLDAAKRSWR